MPEVTRAFIGPSFTDNYASNLFLFGLFYFIHVTKDTFITRNP